MGVPHPCLSHGRNFAAATSVRTSFTLPRTPLTSHDAKALGPAAPGYKPDTCIRCAKMDPLAPETAEAVRPGQATRCELGLGRGGLLVPFVCLIDASSSSQTRLNEHWVRPFRGFSIHGQSAAGDHAGQLEAREKFPWPVVELGSFVGGMARPTTS